MAFLRLYLSLFCCVCVLSIFAQDSSSDLERPNSGKITGVLKFPNGDPVSYAVVYIQELNKHAMSNDDGRYEITNVPFGKHLLEVKTIEADPEAKYVSVDKYHTEFSIVLKENSNYKIDEVVVWGKNEAQQLKEKGFAVSVVETQKAALQSIQATELLDRTAGVRILESGGLGSHIHYNINGLTGNSVRIFIDGIPMRNYGSSFSLSSIPPAQIERIEVYKGVVPAHLSEDALGGAINVVLKKKNNDSKHLSTSYSYGSFNTHRGSLNGDYRNSKTGFTVMGSAFYNYTDNNYKVWGDQVYISEPPSWKVEYVKAKRFHDSYESYGLNTNFGFTNVQWADLFMVGLLYSDMNKDVQHGSTMEVVYGNRRAKQDTRMINLKYNKNDLLIRNLNLTSFISYTYNNRQDIDTIPYVYNWFGNKIWNENTNDYFTGSNTGGEQGEATLAKNKEKTIAGRANLSYQFHPQHRLSANFLYNRFVRDVKDPLLPQAEQDLTETRYLTKQIIGATYDNHFFDTRLKTSLFFKYYIQHVKLKDPLLVDKVLSYVEYDKTVENSGFGATLSYRILPGFLLQASYEKALRMPESNELLGNSSENITSTYELKPEKSYNGNLGILLGPFDFGQHQFRGDVNMFIRDIRDMIIRGGIIDTKSDTYGFENLGKVMSKGFDAEIGYKYNNCFFVTYNVSLFNARFMRKKDENGEDYAYYKNRLRNAPYLTMNANAEYLLSNIIQKGSTLSFNYNFRYVHEFDRNWEVYGSTGKAIIPAQKVHDVGIVYSFPKNKVTVSLDMKNIFNEQVFDNWAQQKPGRAFYGKISYRIF